MLGNPGTILVKAMPKGKRTLKPSFSDAHPKTIASKHPQQKTKKGSCVHTSLCIRIRVYSETFLTVTSISCLCPHTQNVHPPTKVSIYNLKHTETRHNCCCRDLKNTFSFSFSFSRFTFLLLSRLSPSSCKQ